MHPQRPSSTDFGSIVVGKFVNRQVSECGFLENFQVLKRKDEQKVSRQYGYIRRTVYRKLRRGGNLRIVDMECQVQWQLKTDIIMFREREENQNEVIRFHQKNCGFRIEVLRNLLLSKRTVDMFRKIVDRVRIEDWKRRTSNSGGRERMGVENVKCEII